MNLTSVDPPEVIRFVRKNYPEVELIKPKASIYQLAVEKQILPTKRVRWCCAEYKEMAGAGKVTLIGIRHQESSRRKKRKEVEISDRKFSGTLEGLEAYREKIAKKQRRGEATTHTAKGDVNITNVTEERTLGCISGKESLLISPIIHWTERDVWEFLNKVVRVEHCELYDQGFRRIGCIGCPMSNPRQKIMENQRWPHVKRNWIKAIMAIRQGGITQNSYQKNIWGGNLATLRRVCMVEHPAGLPASGQSRQATTGGFSIPTRSTGSRGGQAHQCRPVGGFSGGSSSGGLTDEQEHAIAENIYDWWISGKSYKKWYAERFLQYRLEFEE